MTRPAYEPALDGLRAIAVIAVIAFHARVPGFENGRVGVDLFFVLSGYLITSILISSPSIVDFYRRRFLRLAPALFAYVLIILPLATLWPSQSTHEHVTQGILSLLYVTDIFHAEGGPFLHTWSLSVEAHFYLLWPFIVMLLAQTSQQRAFRLMLLVWVFLTLIRLLILQYTDDWRTGYMTPYGHSTGLVLGAAVAYGKPTLSRLNRSRPGLLGTFVFSICVVALNAPMMLRNASLSLAEISAVAMIVGIWRRGRFEQALSNPAFVKVGMMSYGMYLWHYPIATVLRRTEPWYVTLLAGLLGSLILAALSYYTIEAIGRRWRRTGPSSAN